MFEVVRLESKLADGAFIAWDLKNNKNAQILHLITDGQSLSLICYFGLKAGSDPTVLMKVGYEMIEPGFRRWFFEDPSPHLTCFTLQRLMQWILRAMYLLFMICNGPRMSMGLGLSKPDPPSCSSASTSKIWADRLLSDLQTLWHPPILSNPEVFIWFDHISLNSSFVTLFQWW